MGNVWLDHPELVEELKVLVTEGLSNSQIARRLGHGLTRNSIIGKANRMNLVHAPRAPGRKAFVIPPANGLGGPKQVKTAPKLAAIPKDEPEPLVDEAGNPITVANANDRHCRATRGDPGTPEFRYCGHAVQKGSFCAYHVVKFHDPAHPARGRDVA